MKGKYNKKANLNNEKGDQGCFDFIFCNAA